MAGREIKGQIVVVSKPELVELVARLEGTAITVVGDLILDHYIWGRVERISPEAPVVVVDVTEENKRPGGAGNVVNNLLSLGVDVAVCGVVGDDEAGKMLITLLEQAGADIGNIFVDRTRRTTVKTRVIAHAQQVVRVDREDRAPLSESLAENIALVVENKLSQSDAVVISDYAKGTIEPSLFERFVKAKIRGDTGLTACPIIVDPKAPNFSLYRGVSVIKPNRSEAEAASGIIIRDRATAIKAGRLLLEKWDCDLLLITLGDLGMVLVPKDVRVKPVEIDTVAREVYDVSGAGDTVSAVFSAALAAEASAEDAARLSNIAAGIVVSEVGTVAVTSQELIQAIAEAESI